MIFNASTLSTNKAPRKAEEQQAESDVKKS
jgi:hypothetical protein